ncbi:MAG: hypothetical protein EBQ52_08070 [Synechococcaceae bacterium LLD_019]|nr:hypothetical protein [Synechococcaceae bacterium LLD_019]
MQRFAAPEITPSEVALHLPAVGAFWLQDFSGPGGGKVLIGQMAHLQNAASCLRRAAALALLRLELTKTGLGKSTETSCSKNYQYKPKENLIRCTILLEQLTITPITSDSNLFSP